MTDTAPLTGARLVSAVWRALHPPKPKPAPVVRERRPPQRRERKVKTGSCRCCGIILERAGCGAYDGVCADCWWEARLRAKRWGCGIREALERWIEEGRKIESGEAELAEWCRRIR